MVSLGIETATFRFVAHCLNQLPHRVNDLYCLSSFVRVIKFYVLSMKTVNIRPCACWYVCLA